MRAQATLVLQHRPRLTLIVLPATTVQIGGDVLETAQRLGELPHHDRVGGGQTTIIGAHGCVRGDRVGDLPDLRVNPVSRQHRIGAMHSRTLIARWRRRRVTEVRQLPGTPALVATERALGNTVRISASVRSAIVGVASRAGGVAATDSDGSREGCGFRSMTLRL